jgi:hypothetical protein
MSGNPTRLLCTVSANTNPPYCIQAATGERRGDGTEINRSAEI